MSASHGRRSWHVAAAAAALSVLAACGSSASSDGSPDRAPASTTSTTGGAHVATGLRGERYCEVLLLRPEPAGITASVFNTYPLNACPEAQWRAMDAGAIAKAHGALAALLNGPRYWLMDRIEKDDSRAQTRATFGGMEMIQRATVVVGNPMVASQPYHLNAVDRRTVFSFDAGRAVYEITTSDGTRFVMQSWSRQTDPTLGESDLAGLGSRLRLPAGWTYASRTLTAPLRVDTTTTTAEVFQDELHNTYSMETA